MVTGVNWERKINMEFNLSKLDRLTQLLNVCVTPAEATVLSPLAPSLDSYPLNFKLLRSRTSFPRILCTGSLWAPAVCHCLWTIYLLWSIVLQLLQFWACYSIVGLPALDYCCALFAGYPVTDHCLWTTSRLLSLAFRICCLGFPADDLCQCVYCIVFACFNQRCSWIENLPIQTLHWMSASLQNQWFL